MAQPTTALPTQEVRLTMTYEEYASWADEDTRAEWVDGEVTVFMPPSIVHAKVAGFLHALLMQFAEFFELGTVLMEPVEVRLREGRSYRLPDLLFVAREHLDRFAAMRLNGPADLVIELISEESETRDRVEKLAEYAAAGIPEYWALDPRPEIRRADFLRLTDAGRYEPVALDADGRYHSAVLRGFWLRPEWLWQDPLPFTIDCLREIAPEVLQQRRASTADGEG